MKEHNLISRLKSVKRFFLLDQGDFLNQFIDLADDELKMPVSDITSSRLEALLEISIRTSAADKDPYKDDLKVVLSDKDLITQERYSQDILKWGASSDGHLVRIPYGVYKDDGWEDASHFGELLL